MIVLRLSFRSLENIKLKKWIRMTSYIPLLSTLLSIKQIRHVLNTQALISREIMI